MARLGEVLLSEKFLTPHELDLALENHVLHGVKLGTCLVEMGLVADDDLARCLGKRAGLAFMTQDQLLAFGSQYLSVISPTAMKEHRLIPVGIHGGTVRIATDHEFSRKKQAEIERFLGQRIELVVVSGYAVDFFLEQMFGIQRPGRFLPKYSRMNPPEMAPAALHGSSRESAPVIIDGIEWKRLGEAAPDGESAHVCDDSAAVFDRDDAPRSLSAAAERLSLARSRDDVAGTVLDYISGSGGGAALFLVKDGVVRGWKACTKQRILPEFEAFSAPLETLPELQECVITQKPYWGNSQTPETKQLLQMLQFSGGRPACFPIFIRNRIIAVLLCDGSDGPDPREAGELCRKASYALEILILRSKLLNS